MEDIPKIKQQLNIHYRTIQKWISSSFDITRREQKEYIEDATTTLKDNPGGILGQTFLSLTSSLVTVFLLPIYTFLILYYRGMIKNFLINVFSGHHKEKVNEVLQESKKIVQSYMVGLLIEMSIVTAINSLGFFIIGIKYPVFLGLLAAILNLIPYIGMMIASVFCMLVTLTTSNNIADVLWVLAVLTLVQFFDNNLIMPKVVGSKVKINALMTIFGVIIGGGIIGLSGMFLSIPFIAILKAIFDRVEGLEPWGQLLGDEVTGSEQIRIYKRSRRKKVNA
jgi:predicted PurR-regulated permease PerM